MGHLINPITYRLGKTKFWNYTWVNKTKKNYKNLLIEDLNFYKFSKWLLAILSWHKIGIFIHDFKIIKKFNSLDFCLFFFLKRLNLLTIYKKFSFNFFIKNSFLNFFFKTLLNRKLISCKSFFLIKKKKQKISLSITKKKKIFFKKKKVLKIFLKNTLKKKKKNKKKLWLNNFLFNYCSFLLKKNKLYKKKFIKKFNFFLLFKSLRFNIFFLKNLGVNNILQKNFLLRTFNYKFFFRILTFFLTFFIKKVFKHKNVNFNFFSKKYLFFKF